MFNENGLQVEFYDESMEHRAESAKKGRPVYKDRTLVKIVNPVDMNVVIVRAATADDKQKYRKAYQAYQNEAKSSSVDGMPLREWPAVTRSQAREAAFYNILTVEQVADLSSDQIGELGSEWEPLRKKAQLYLKGSEDSAAALALADENEQLKKQLAALQQAAHEQGANKQQRGPGRPPKSDAKQDDKTADKE